MEISLSNQWEKVKLGKVCKLKNGFAFKSPDYTADGVPVIRISDIKEGLVTSKKAVRVLPTNEYQNYLIENNDILVAMSGATTGKFGVFRSSEEAYQNQRVGKFSILCKEKLNNEFLLYQLHSLKRQIEKDAYGGAQPNISSTKIEEMEITLPPLHEQHQIVEKIEELFSELDKGIENLKTAQQQLKVYRQAVLKSAFEGKLTNDNVKDGELPEGWELETLGNVSESCLGKMLDRGKNKGTPAPYLRNINVRWNAFNLENLFEMPFEAKESERYSLKDGDLVICEGGEPGRAAIWKNQMPGMKIQKALHRVRFNKNVKPVFFLYYLNWIASTKKIDKYFTGTTIKHLTGQSLKKITFPLPPVEEQQRILFELESRLSVCDKMEETITTSLQQTEALRQSILKRAFEGKLVKR